MTDAVTTRVVEHTDASDLPEVNWTWRRWFVFMVTIAALALVWRIVEKSADIVTLRMIARYSLALAALMALLYIAGASSEQVVKLLQAAKTTRKETITTGVAT